MLAMSMADTPASPWNDPEVVRLSDEAEALGLDLALQEGEDLWRATLVFDGRGVRSEVAATPAGAAREVLRAYHADDRPNGPNRRFAWIVFVFLLVGTAIAIAFFALHNRS